jgi:peptide/nickel transport system substrate-binding protein
MRGRCCSFLAAALLFAPTGGAPASELRLGFSADVLTMDPGNHRRRETETILRNMYDGLFTRDADMRLQPELVRSWRRLDPLVYEFTLHDSITFHDGSPLTAEDVAFTFDRLIGTIPIDGKTSPRKPLLGPLQAIEVVDRLTVRFRLGEPWPQLLTMLPFQEVVSKHFADERGDIVLGVAVNGAGPFRLVKWQPGAVVVMGRYDGYYGGAVGIPPRGPACVERVVIEVIPDTDSRLAALLAGDVHLVDQVPAYALAAIERVPGVRSLTVDGTRSVFLALNLRTNPFADPRMRRAALSAIDRDGIVKTLLHGNATRIEGILGPQTLGKNRDLPVVGYNPFRARSLLAEAGYANGVDLTLEVDPSQRDVAAAIADSLSGVGLRTKVVVSDQAALRAKWLSDRTAGPYDMWLTSWGNASLDPFDIFEPTHKSGGDGNSSGYANAELDTLLERAAMEADPDARARLYGEAEAIASADLSYLYLWVPKEIYGISDRVSGWRPSSDGRINLHDVCLKDE